MHIFRPHMQVAAKVMDLQLERQNLVMGNLANITTPRYRPRSIEFEKELQQALNQDMRGRMTKTEKNHMPATFDPQGYDANAEQEFQPRYIYGEDRVDLDKEMAVMSKNSMQYNALTTIMQKHFMGVNKVISEGGK